MNNFNQNEDLENRHKLNENNDLDQDVKGLIIQNDESNPFNKWALDSVYAYYLEAGSEDEFWDVITHNESVMQMKPDERFKRSIIVGEKIACRLLNLTAERNESDEDYNQLYELRLRGNVYKFSKSCFDSLIKKYPDTIEGLKNDPRLLGYLMNYHMPEFLHPNLPYSANPAGDNLGSDQV